MNEQERAATIAMVRSGEPATLTRREAIARLAGGGAAAALAMSGVGAFAAVAQGVEIVAGGGRKRSLRVAHITDVHLQPEVNAPEGFATCLRHIQSQSEKPEFILNTGDSIMDALRQEKPRVDQLWNTWSRVWKAECSLPAAHAIGNHDVWGWDKDKSGTKGDEVGWGKRRALDALGIERSYYSFDRAGWHFVVLDSIHKLYSGYTAKLDDEQFAWLEADLAKTPAATNVLVMSHIPIFSITPVLEPKADAMPGEYDPTTINRASMHSDYRRLKDLFKKHRNVRAAVSGHMHLIDRVDLLGVSYLCDGAVCGGWWRHDRDRECTPGYGLIDLYDDGSIDHRYVNYGWVNAGEGGGRKA